MRICMVTSFYPPYNYGGDGIFVESLAELLAADGHDVTVIHCEDAFRVNGNAPEDAPPRTRKVNGVTVHRLKSRFGILSPLLSHQAGHPALKSGDLRRLLDEDFDVINFHNTSLMGGPGVLRFGRARIKLYTLHEHWLVCPTHILWKYKGRACDGRECLRCSLHAGIPPQLWRYTSQTATALKQVDCFISPSRFTADQHRSIFGKLPIRVLPHFSRLRPGPMQGGKRSGFVYVGRVTAAKGIEPLLRLFSALPQHELTVVGDGDLLPIVREQYRNCENVRFEPFVDKSRLVSIYASARALILPSLAPETFGLTVVEAMSCGTPAIVRESGGCAEIVRDTGVGIVYETERELAAAIDELANNQDSDSLAERARKAVDRLYSPERYVERYLNLVDEMAT